MKKQKLRAYTHGLGGMKFILDADLTPRTPEPAVTQSPSHDSVNA